MEIREFLRANVESYLFNDLRTMIRAAPAQWSSGGGVGYPLVMSSFAGIELLGELLLDGDFPTRGSQEAAFLRYWSDFLYPEKPRSAEMGRTLYKLARHGIAHVFVLKGPLKVGFATPGYHLTLDSDGCVTLNAKDLAEDLIRSYERRVLPLLRVDADASVVAQMQHRLDGMEREYNKQSARDGAFEAFAPAPGPPLRRGAPELRPIDGPTGPVFSGAADSKTVSASFLTPVWPRG